MKLIDEIRISFTRAEGLFRLMFVNVIIFLFIGIAKMILFLAGSTGMPIMEAINLLAVKSNLSQLLRQPWTIISYMFVHENFLHVLFNMLVLYWSGKLFCEYLGSRKIVTVYILGGIAGAAFYILAYNFFPVFNDIVLHSKLIGASAGVIAVLVAIATLIPNYPMQLLLFGSVRLKFIALFLVLLYIISIPDGNAGGNISHLGGAVFGFTYIKGLRSGNDIGKWFENMIDFFMRIFKPTGRFKVIHKAGDPYKAGRLKFTEPRQEVIDAILDKISRSGYASLTKEEKEILFSASKSPGKES
jgi:membrane associated rhomboid family serine protease